jgi:NAD(P)-dependent dehydrogenase (short-subunit alcohol dehydrogenase family)
MQDEFSDQTAVVTGAARGLGKACATLLAERGATVFLIDLDRDGLKKTCEELTGKGHDVHGIVADLTSETEVDALRAAIEAQCGGKLHVLVNNAGGWRHASMREIELPDWEWTFNTNLTGMFLVTRALMDMMVQAGYGRIVNVASTDAHKPKPTLPHYAAAKAGVVSMTMTLAEELAPSGVLVNAVSPGAIGTETAKKQDWFKERVKVIPVGYAAEPEDIAEVILFLASRRNRFVVGETVKVNGGILIG